MVGSLAPNSAWWSRRELACASSTPPGGSLMELSARNQLRGTVKSVYKGSVLAEVIVDVGGQEMVSTITRRSAERLNLSEGDTVVAIIKATEVMLGKE